MSAENLIYVRARREQGDRVALWETNPAHPGGEVFIAGPDVVQVARTPLVLTRLAPNISDGGTLEELRGEALDVALEEQRVREEQRAAGQQRVLAVAAGDVEKSRQLDETIDKLTQRVNELEQQLASALAEVDEEDTARAEARAANDEPTSNVQGSATDAGAQGAATATPTTTTPPAPVAPPTTVQSPEPGEGTPPTRGRGRSS